MIKKISAVLLAVTMLLSMSFTVAAAREGIVTLIWTPAGAEAPGEVCYIEGEENLFTVAIKVEGPATVAMHDVVLTYNKEVVKLVDAEGNDAEDPKEAVTPFTEAFELDMCTFLENGDLSILGIKKGVGSIDMPADGILFTLTCKAIAAGDAGMRTTSLYKAVNGGEEWTITDETAADATIVKAKAAPPAASAFSLKDGKAQIAHHKEVEATYTFDNGERTPGADRTAGDVSEVKWYVEGIAEAVGTGKTLTLEHAAWVGKKLSYTVLPKTNVRTTDAEGTLSEAQDCGYIMPADGYTPSLSAVTIEGGQILAARAAKAVAAFEKTYENAEYVATYAWHVDGAAQAAQTGESVTFARESIGKTVAIRATVSIVIGGEVFATSLEKDSESYTIKSEPPTLEIGADLASRAPYASSSLALREGEGMDVYAKSNAEGDTAAPTLTYAWYVTDAFVAAEAFQPEGKEVLGTSATFQVPAATEGKYVVVVITAKDALDSTTTKTVAFTNPIARVQGGGGGTIGGGGGTFGGGGSKTEAKEEKPTNPAEDDPAGAAIEEGAAAFTDISRETYAWAYDSIDTLAKAGVIKGMTATTFGPERTATNAQVIALAVRIAGLKTKRGDSTDLVAKDHWVQAEMAAAEKAGILTVFGGKVDVEAVAMREVAFTLLYSALKAASATIPETAEAISFADESSFHPSCVEAINALTKAGIINGMGDGTLAPKATITRAQLAKILGLASALIQ